MSKKLYTVTIVSCETGNEYALIREALESYSVRVIHEPIGRPYDFIDFLTGETYFESDFVIFAFHGEGGKFYMPELGESVYEEDEPRSNFGVEEITRYCRSEERRVGKECRCRWWSYSGNERRCGR